MKINIVKRIKLIKRNRFVVNNSKTISVFWKALLQFIASNVQPNTTLHSK